MKRWKLPVINVEKFTANEYVAACTPAGSNSFTLECDNDELHSYGDAQHQDSNPHNDMPITLADGALRGFSGKKTRWFTKNGSLIKTTDTLTNIPDADETGYSDYIWGFQYNVIAKKYFYHIYRKSGNSYIEYSGWHVALAGAGNPSS